MKKTKFKDIALMGIFILCVVLSPIILTRPAISSILDFTLTGQIGDTIGGITSPIIGILSVILLYLTLKQQNEINAEQKNYNDINRAIAMQSQIKQMDYDMEFVYSDGRICHKANGCQSLHILNRSDYGIKISSIELNDLIADVHNLELSISMWIMFLRDSDMYEETKKLSANIADTYLHRIQAFYSDIMNDHVVYILADGEQFNKTIGKPSYDEELHKTISQYNISVSSLLNLCSELQNVSSVDIL